MATVSSSLKIFDSMTRPIQNITQGMNLMISTMHQMQNATNQNVNIDKMLVTAKGKLVTAEADIRSAIDEATAAQNRFNNAVNKSNSGVLALWGKLKSIAAVYLSFQAVKSGILISDDYINTQARLNLINDGLQTTRQRQDQIFASARRSRGLYSDMASSVSKLGILAGEAFSGNSEIISFTELMQKSFRIGGSSTTEQQAGMYQLTQAMAAGKLQGDEFRSIMENAPMLADAIAKFTGKSKGDLKEMSSKGLITADIIKGALFTAADDIDAKFAALPLTFSDKFNDMKNTALQNFGSVIERVNKFVNSPTGEAFFNSINWAIILAANTVNGFIDALAWIGMVMQQNWGIIEPILFAIGGALLLWTVAQIPLLISQFNKMIIRLWLMLEPILAQAAAWLIVNWPILLIGAAIGFLILALYKWSDTTTEVLGYVGGIFGILFAFLFNKFAYFANIVMSVAEFFVNVWRDPVYAVKKLFFDLVANSLEYLNNLAKGVEKILNAIPGVNVSITGGMDNILSQLKEARDNLHSDKDVVSLMRFQQKDYGEAFDIGQKIGEAAGRFASKGVKSAADAVSGMFDMSKFGLGNDPTKGMNIDRVNEVGKIGSTVDISSEDLKTMRELAEMKNIQNFVSLTPTVQVTHTGDIRQDSDIDTLVARITDKLETEIASSAKGTYDV